MSCSDLFKYVMLFVDAGRVLNTLDNRICCFVLLQCRPPFDEGVIQRCTLSRAQTVLLGAQTAEHRCVQVIT